MYPSYSDIKTRIAEAPAWYDAHGVPRYGAPPADLRPFMRRVACQSCGQQFLVCLAGEIYKTLYDAGFQARVTAPCPHDPKVYHAVMEYCRLTDLDPETGRLAARPLPAGWHYGDPPYHDCVGDSMNSIPDYEWEPGAPGQEEQRDGSAGAADSRLHGG